MRARNFRYTLILRILVQRFSEILVNVLRSCFGVLRSILAEHTIAKRVKELMRGLITFSVFLPWIQELHGFEFAGRSDSVAHRPQHINPLRPTFSS